MYSGEVRPEVLWDIYLNGQTARLKRSLKEHTQVPELGGKFARESGIAPLITHSNSFNDPLEWVLDYKVVSIN